MEVLVIGGTKFVGRALTESLLRRGHRVTHFNRGKTAPSLFPSVETVAGDRATEITNLPDRNWDAVVDTCGYQPGVVGTSARHLRDKVGRYLFVSSVSVYSDDNPPLVGEDGAVSTPEFRDLDTDATTYGPMKVAAEQVVRDTYGDRATVVRPGIIIGPHDHTWRFTYWPHRFRQGGDVLVPDLGSKRITSVDVRDFAEFQVQLLEDDRTGTFNVDNDGLTFGDLVRACSAGTDARQVLVDDAFLAEQGVEGWTDLPVVLRGKHTLGDTAAAQSMGLENRPLSETVQDLMAWVEESGVPDQRPGLTLERESEVLAAWRARA